MWVVALLEASDVTKHDRHLGRHIPLGARGLSCAVSGFGQLLKSDPREKPLDQSAISLIAPSQLQPRLYQTDWFLGDIECFKCSDWITITIGA